MSRPLNLIGCHGNRKPKFAKTSSPQKGDEAETLQEYSYILYNHYVFIDVAHVLSLLWQLKISIDL